MAILSFNFTGWCRADITKALDIKSDCMIDVSNMPAQELAYRLNKGELAINFVDVYVDQSNGENEINGFTPFDDDDADDGETLDDKSFYPNKGYDFPPSTERW
jgi:hypothetical protein